MESIKQKYLKLNELIYFERLFPSIVSIVNKKMSRSILLVKNIYLTQTTLDSVLLNKKFNYLNVRFKVFLTDGIEYLITQLESRVICLSK